jgi:hypothetical protein
MLMAHLASLAEGLGEFTSDEQTECSVKTVQ